MVDLVGIQAAYYMVAATGVLVAAIYYVLNMRNAEKLRKTQVVLSWFSQLQTKEYHRHYIDIVLNTKYANFEDWEKKYRGDINAEAHATFFALLNQLDYVGFMLREKIAEPESIYRIVPPSWIIIAWTKIAPVFRRQGEMLKDPKIADLAEYLYDETVKRYPEIAIPPERTKLLFGIEA